VDQRFFADVRRLIARGSIEPALNKVVNAVQGVREELGSGISNAAILLSGRFFAHQLDKLNNIRPVDDLDREMNRLTRDLLGLLTLVESQWGDLPEPAVGPRPDVESDQVPSGRLPDPREAAIAGSPLRRLAWLQQGLTAARAVCKIRTPKKVGTGFLVRGGKVITNNHVLPTKELCENTLALFNFEEDIDGRPTEPVTIRLASETFRTSPAPDIDCTVVGLRASSESLARWGFLELDTQRELPETSGVSIIQHPEGGYKQIAVAGNVISKSDERAVHYVTSTMPGSSGAPVFDDDWKVIALHQGAGNWSEEHHRYLNNKGIRFSAISADPALMSEFV
jgi:V8-like Glu-specific endopeptidase